MTNICIKRKVRRNRVHETSTLSNLMSKNVSNEETVYFNCLIEMLENLEEQIEFSNDYLKIQSLNTHKKVVMKLVDQITFSGLIQ